MDSLEPLPPREDGRVLIESLDAWMWVEGENLVIVDAQTGERFVEPWRIYADRDYHKKRADDAESDRDIQKKRADELQQENERLLALLAGSNSSPKS